MESTYTYKFRLYPNIDNRFLIFFIGLIFIIFIYFCVYLGTSMSKPINYSTGVKDISDELLLSPWTRDTIPWKGW